jgi:glyoxylase-like metal-dependent hydrolase (beta-lactamase superfamily II)
MAKTVAGRQSNNRQEDYLFDRRHPYLKQMTEIHSINTGFFRLDGGAMFGVIPRILWQRQHAPDEQNRILQALRVLLIIDGQRTILVDTGLGNWHDEKFIDRYAVENPDFDFDCALAGYNISAKDITDLIITHLHFDHAGGLVTRKGSGIVPTFPNARIWVQEEHWRWAQSPSAKDKGGFMSTYLKFLENCSLLELPDGGTDVTENVSLLVFNGHSPAMQTVIIKSETATYFFASDLIPNASHIHIPFIMAYDNNPVLTAEEKEKILSCACREKWIVYFPHDPVYEKGCVISRDGKYSLGQN